MITLFRTHPLVSVIGAFLLGGLLVIVIAIAVSPRDSDADNAGVQAPLATPPSATPTEAAAPPAGPAECGDPTHAVESAEQLEEALEEVGPGDVIVLAPGTYVGNFVATTSGTKGDPITLCGGSDSVLDGDDVEKNYVFHLDGAQYWHLSGFSVTNGQKGVMADTTVGSLIEGLTVSHTGDEAIHLRNFSTDNIVRDNIVSDTGHRKPKFGEGIYIGTAESNWCDITNCEPDRSDRNVVEGNTISDTTSESVDIKEGTTGGILRDNTFDGSSLEGDADSWVDVKGNEWLIEGNEGTNSPLDGYQTHEILDGWGTDNVFRNNSAAVNGDGFGFSLTPERDNVVECSNTVSAAGEGYSNVDCSG